MASPPALCASLGATEEGHINIRKHPKEGYRDSEVSRGQDVREAAEVPGVLSTEQGRLRGGLMAAAAPHRERRGGAEPGSV